MPPRIAIIGAGDWSRRMHRPAIQRLARADKLTVAAVCDLDAEKASAYAASVGAELSFTDPAAMIEQCKPDALALVVSPSATAGLIELAAQRGVPFLTEKPPAPDAATQRRLIERVGNLTHLIAYNRRFAPYSRQAREWLAGQAVQSITCMFARHRRRDADFTTTAVHGIDAVRFLAGSDFADLHMEVAPVGTVWNYFLTGWTVGGTHVDIVVTPDTASAQEHYVLRAADRSVLIVFPHASTMDVPGYIELHERNRLVARLGPGNFGANPDDLPALLGIVAEHETFLGALAGGQCDSTLVSTLQTEVVRDELVRLLAQASSGGTRTRVGLDVDFARTGREEKASHG